MTRAVTDKDALLAQQETLIKNRFTFARLAWEPRLFDPHLNKWIKRIDLPTQIIWGEQDRIAPIAVAKQIAPAHQQAIANILGAMFGTPDAPVALPETGLVDARAQRGRGDLRAAEEALERAVEQRRLAEAQRVLAQIIQPARARARPYACASPQRRSSPSRPPPSTTTDLSRRDARG